MNKTARIGVLILLAAVIVRLMWSPQLPDNQPAATGYGPNFVDSERRALTLARESPLIVSGEVLSTSNERRDLASVTIRVLEVHRNFLRDVELRSGQHLHFRVQQERGRTSWSALHIEKWLGVGKRTMFILRPEGDGHFYTSAREFGLDTARIEWATWLLAHEDGAPELRSATKWEWISRKPRAFNISDDTARENSVNAAQFFDRLMEDGRFRSERLPEVLAKPLATRLSIAAMKQITARLDDESWQSLQFYLLAHDDSASVRTAVVTNLGYSRLIKRSDVKAALAKSLNDPSSSVRLFACQALKFANDESWAQDVIPLLADQDAEVRATAVRTLGWIGSAEHVRPILTLYESSQHEQQDEWVFAEALSRLGETKVSLQAALNSLRSEDRGATGFAIRALEFNESQEVAPVLIGELVPELRRTCHEMRVNGGGDMVAVVCAELEKRTGEKFGDDVPAWQQWWEEQCAKYALATVDVDDQMLDELMEEYSSLKAN